MSINAGLSVYTTQPVPPFQIDATTLVDDQILVYDSAAQAFVNVDASNSTTVGTVPGAQGNSLVVSAVDGNIILKTLTAGSGINIVDQGSSLRIDADANNNIQGVNIGSGAQVFESKQGWNLQFRSVKNAPASKNFTVTQTSNEIILQSLAEINTGTNTGIGAGVFRGKTGETLEFKRIKGAAGLTVTDGSDDITLGINYGFAVGTSGYLVVNNGGSLATLAPGAAGTVLTSTGTGTAWSANVSNSYTFRVTFEQDGGVDQVTNLPAGWSYTMSGNLITVTHTVGKPIRHITYWGWDSVGSNYRCRYPTGTYQVQYPGANENSQFSFNIISQVAGAEVNGHARISVVF